MLGSESRLRRTGEFRDTMRQGVRCGRRSLVLHARKGPSEYSRVGFIVPKTVGKAVTRNRVKRRLRHLAAERISGSPFPVDLVVRALPAATTADLVADFDSALDTCLDRLAA
ncbi:MAG TPA: ribonuclease P protein component [Propionibacteriaceae bacterium]|nr:ribonuclease P protein component [Propionibacteriaceae bacterium]